MTQRAQPRLLSRLFVSLSTAALLHCGAKSELYNPPIVVRCRPELDTNVTAVALMTADDEYKLFANGVLIDDRVRPWTQPELYVLNLFRNPQRANVIAVQATNRFNQDGIDRGFVGDITLMLPAAPTAVHIVTDASWKLQLGEVANFHVPSFNDSSWPNAIDEGPNGTPPWGPILGESRARWLWAYMANSAAGTKPMVETVSARKTFYIGINGTIHDTPQPCQ